MVNGRAVQPDFVFAISDCAVRFLTNAERFVIAPFRAQGSDLAQLRTATSPSSAKTLKPPQNTSLPRVALVPTPPLSRKQPEKVRASCHPPFMSRRAVCLVLRQHLPHFLCHKRSLRNCATGVPCASRKFIHASPLSRCTAAACQASDFGLCHNAEWPRFGFWQRRTLSHSVVRAMFRPLPTPYRSRARILSNLSNSSNSLSLAWLATFIELPIFSLAHNQKRYARASPCVQIETCHVSWVPHLCLILLSSHTYTPRPAWRSLASRKLIHASPLSSAYGCRAPS